MKTPDLPQFFRPIAFDTIGSTNDELKRLATQGAGEGTLIVADEQPLGRGRRGRIWASPRGNLAMSVLLRPRRPAAEAPHLAFVTAVAVAEAVAARMPADRAVRCKWPNDILVDGRKTAGILLESEADPDGTLAWLVAGVGVNVVSHPPDEETCFPATSLRASGAATVTAADLLADIAPLLLRWYERWQAEGFAPVREAWRRCAYGLGQRLTVRTEGELLDGRFVDIDAAGALVLDDGTAQRHLAAGDVVAARP